jgi:hypothetical protein
MAFATGEVMPTPGDEHPFKVVFTVGGSVIAEWPVKLSIRGRRSDCHGIEGAPCGSQERRVSKVMPRGPKGEMRPADVIGNAVKVMRIAVGEDVDKVATIR